MLIQFLINGLINGVIIALSSLGFALVYNTTRIFHIAYSILFMIAPYLFLSLSIKCGFPILLGVMISIIAIILLSISIQLFIYQPLEKKKSSLHVIMISSIGIMIIGVNLVALFYGNETQLLNTSISNNIKIANIFLTYPQVLQFVIGTTILVLFLLFLKFSKFGIKTRALRDDSKLCEINRMSVSRFKILLFGISGFFVATAGVLVAWDIGMDPYVGMPMLLNAVVALIIGGIGRFHAPIIGGIVLGLVHSFVIWKFSSNWMETVTFVLLIILLIYRPQGLFGEKRREA